MTVRCAHASVANERHDIGRGLSYREVMERFPAHIILKLELEDPIEIEKFVSIFTGLANQFDKFIRTNYPELPPETQIYVKELRPGSIVADLVPWVATALPLIATHMEHALVIEQFIKTYWERLSLYFKPGGRDPEATRSDLKDFIGGVAAIATDPNAKATIEAAVFEDGKREVRAAITFSTPESRKALRSLEAHRLELEKSESADYERQLMVFRRMDREDAKVGRPTGERVIINRLSPQDLPLIYASQMAEDRIKHEMREAKENVFKKGFVVDVNMETAPNGRPRAYRVTSFHQVIDLDDEG
jgi:hypothetical protein